MNPTITKNLLAASVFLTKPNDKLATLDVYNKTNRSVVNSIQDIARLFNVDSTNIMRGGALISQAFPALQSVAGGLSINVDNLTARISSLSKTVSSALSQAGAGIAGAIGSIKLPDSVYSVINGVKSEISSVNITGLNQLTGLVQNITGNRTLMQAVDPTAEASLYLGIISEATRNGIPNSYNSVLSQLTDPTVKGLVSNNAVNYAIQSSDTRMLSSIVGNSSTGSLLNLGINIVQAFSSNYRSNYGYDEINSTQEFSDLTTTYTQIDPNWNTTTVTEAGSSTTVIDISSIVGATSDFEEKLLAYLKFRDNASDQQNMMALATKFGKTTVDIELKKMLPYMVLQPVTQTA